MTQQEQVDELVTYAYHEWPSVVRQWPVGQVEDWARRLIAAYKRKEKP